MATQHALAPRVKRGAKERVARDTEDSLLLFTISSLRRSATLSSPGALPRDPSSLEQAPPAGLAPEAN